MSSTWLRDVTHLLHVTKGSQGVFRSDDSYIILDSRFPSADVLKDGQPASTESGEKEYRGWLWYGKTSKSPEEAVTRSKQLATALGISIEWVKLQQTEEPKDFVELFAFKGGLTFIEPVVLKKQQNLRLDQHVKALYLVKGKKNPRVKRIPVSPSALNSGDVLILDDDVKIWQWNGTKCNRMERGKALDMTTRFRDERMNRIKADVLILQEGKEQDEFWKVLGGKPESIPCDKETDDEAFENLALQEDKLYKASMEDGQISISLVDRGDQHLHREMLEHANCYIVDCETEIFVWNGRDSDSNMRVEAATYAEGLKSQKLANGSPRPDFVIVNVISQSAEPALFKSKFRGPFKEYVETPVHYQHRLTQSHKIAKIRQEKINVDAMHHPEKYAAAKEDEIVFFERLIANHREGDPSEWTIFFVKHKQMYLLPKDEYGTFHAANSYVLHYMLKIPGSETRHFVYFWLGRHASIDDKGAASMLCADLAKQFGRGVVQIRVVQHKEPEHFMSHFKNSFVVLKGNRDDWEKEKHVSNILLNVRGKNPVTMTAVEVENISASLSSCDVAVLVERLTKTYKHAPNAGDQAEIERLKAAAKQRVLAAAEKQAEEKKPEPVEEKKPEPVPQPVEEKKPEPVEEKKPERVEEKKPEPVPTPAADPEPEQPAAEPVAVGASPEVSKQKKSKREAPKKSSSRAKVTEEGEKEKEKSKSKEKSKKSHRKDKSTSDSPSKSKDKTEKAAAAAAPEPEKKEEEPKPEPEKVEPAPTPAPETAASSLPETEHQLLQQPRRAQKPAGQRSGSTAPAADGETKTRSRKPLVRQNTITPKHSEASAIKRESSIAGGNARSKKLVKRNSSVMFPKAELSTPKNKVYIWRGKFATDAQVAFAKDVVNTSSFGETKEVVEVAEGQEPAAFWEGFAAGKGNQATRYDTTKRVRFFQCNERTSVFKPSEIEGFTQDDLLERGAAILDGYDEVFVWVGKAASQREKEMTIATAEDYIREADDNRPKDTPLYIVKSGSEQPEFTTYFHGWERVPGEIPLTKAAADTLMSAIHPLEKHTFSATPPLEASTDSNESVAGSDTPVTAPGTPEPKAAPSAPAIPSVERAALETPKKVLDKAPRSAPVSTVSSPALPRTSQPKPEKNPLNADGLYFDYDRLRVKPLPPGVKEPSKLESYLTPDEFLQFVKMTPEEFYSKPKWKQLEVKKAAGLF